MIYCWVAYVYKYAAKDLGLKISIQFFVVLIFLLYLCKPKEKGKIFPILS